MEKENLDTRHQLETVKLENAELRKKISTLDSEIMLLENNVETLRRRDENGNTGSKTIGESNDLAGWNKRRLLSPGGSDTTHRIAFSVALTHDVSIGRLQTINYDKIITKLGNGYEASDGHFIALLRGLYLLTATALNYKGQYQPLEMVRNGIQLATLYCGLDSYNMASQTVIVVLEQSDKIWVRRFRDEGLASLFARPDELYNTFSGVLIYEIYKI